MKTSPAGQAAALRVVAAAGAVVWRRQAGSIQVLLVHRPRYQDWSFPKGKQEPNELLPVCAVREVAEETGLRIALGRPLPRLSYPLADGSRKDVYYWTAQVAGEGILAPERQLDAAECLPAWRALPRVQRAASSEIDAVKWVSLTAAPWYLQRENERLLLAQVCKWAQEGTLACTNLLLWRHGKARARSSWNQHAKGDELRPLTALGQKQARTGAALVGAFGAEILLSSPWRRCWQTVQPYSLTSQLPVQAAPALSEADHARDPRETVAFVADLVRQAASELQHPEPAGFLVCVHRPVLATIVDALAQWADFAAPAQPGAAALPTFPRAAAQEAGRWWPPENPWLAPGELWQLTLGLPYGEPRLLSSQTWQPLP